MIKKTLIFIGISVVYFAQAQDVSTIRNTVDVYSNSSIGGTSKYKSMVGSVGALGGDYSTLNSNPAGIGVNIANDLSGTLEVASLKNTSNYNNSSTSYKINGTNLGNAGGIMVFRLRESSKWKFVNFGINYTNQSIENYIETGGNNNIVYTINDVDGANIANLAYKGHAYNRYGNISKISVGIGTNYNNNLYLGVGVNFHTSNLDQYDSAAFITQNGTTDYYQKQNTPFLEDSNGFSATVGIIGKVNNNFRLGAAIETPTWWNISRTYNFYGDPLYGDGTGTEDRKLITPLKSTLSAAFVANKDFSVNVDYVLGLTKPSYKVYSETETELNDFLSNQYKKLSEVRVGAEYRLKDFRLRGGYSFTSNPFNATSLSALDLNGNALSQSYDNLFLGKRNTLAFGIGYDFKSFYIDAAYQNITSKYSNPFIQGFADYNAGYFSNDYIVEFPDAIVSEVEEKRNNFFITLGWKF